MFAFSNFQIVFLFFIFHFSFFIMQAQQSVKILYGADTIMVHPDDNNNSVIWRYDWTSIGVTSSTDGRVNTSYIVKTYGDVPGRVYAARICDTINTLGYDDWYLPSENEALIFYANKTAIGNFSSTIYWTSTKSKAMSLTTGGT